MIGIIWSLITGNPVARLLAKIAGIALAVLTFGALQRRQGAQAAKAKARADQAEATVEALHRANEGRNEAVTDLRKGKTPAEIVAGNTKKWSKRK